MDPFITKIILGCAGFFLAGGVAGFVLAARVLPRERKPPFRVAMDLHGEDAIFRMQEVELERHIGPEMNAALNRAAGITDGLNMCECGGYVDLDGIQRPCRAISRKRSR